MILKSNQIDLMMSAGLTAVVAGLFLVLEIISKGVAASFFGWMIYISLPLTTILSLGLLQKRRERRTQN
jgi:hypothetical protein